jgi:hypothetical protein
MVEEEKPQNSSIHSDEKPLSKKKQKVKKSFSEQVTFWIGIIGSLVTLSLTAWNTHTKFQIDKSEQALKDLEISLKERETGVEESKERVDRYKWVLSLFPLLNANDLRERNFTINLIRLALTKDEAEQLFVGLQASSDTTLQSVGQSGISAIQNEPIAILVSQMNASTANVRKSAVASLVRDYKSSSLAITIVLGTYEKDKIGNLSRSAIINGLYYLGSTDPTSWNKQQLIDGKQVILNVEAKGPGDQTKAVLNNFKSLLQQVETNINQ